MKKKTESNVAKIVKLLINYNDTSRLLLALLSWPVAFLLFFNNTCYAQSLAHSNGVLKYPIHVFCGTGDHLWVFDKEPVNSHESINAMFDWMSQTYNLKRMYWRGGQEDMWRMYYKFGKASVQHYDYTEWVHKLYSEKKINDIAVAAAKRVGAEIFLYSGLFEHGVQPDVGIIEPYLFEDKLRIDHPEWIPTDRWGSRVNPGPLDFSYPEVRRILIKRYVDYIQKNGYDGINFYTYVENTGIRYLDEFGYNQSVIDEFNKKYPRIDPAKVILTKEQKLYWYKCRGRFVTDFIRELTTALRPYNKKLSIILDAENPDYVQSWWSKPLPGTGMIYLDWKTWISEGIVDELWVQLADFEKQKLLLDKLLKLCKHKNIKLTVRTDDPFADHWLPYVQAGVTPIGVITSPKNGIDKYSFQPTTNANTLKSADWKIRLQNLSDIPKEKLPNQINSIIPFTKDENILVRRKAMQVLANLDNQSAILTLEQGLSDKELAVRIAAAVGLKNINRKESISSLLKALEQSGDFPFKAAVSETLGKITQKDNINLLYDALNSSNFAVKEVAVRSISLINRVTLYEDAFDRLLKVATNRNEDYRIRWWAIKGLQMTLGNASTEQKGRIWKVIHDVLVEDDAVLQLQSATIVRESISRMIPEFRISMIDVLAKLFKEFGDETARPDAAYGWRSVGNALTALGPSGATILEKYRQQKNDKWLAWLAYQVLYVEQFKIFKTDGGFNLISEKKAIQNHEKYAPPFPGWRKW